MGNRHGAGSTGELVHLEVTLGEALLAPLRRAVATLVPRDAQLGPLQLGDTLTTKRVDHPR